MEIELRNGTRGIKPPKHPFSESGTKKKFDFSSPLRPFKYSILRGRQLQFIVNLLSKHFQKFESMYLFFGID